MKQLLSNEEMKNMCLEIKHCFDNLEYNLHSIKIDKVLERMGFPINWENIVDMEKKVL